MVVKETDNICVICGETIPEGRQACPICGTSEGDTFARAMSRPIKQTASSVQAEFESAYRQGFAEGMKHACEIKQENEKLKKHNAILIAAIERRAREDDIDGCYE